MRWHYSLHQHDRRITFMFFVLWVMTLLLSSLFYIYGPLYLPLWYSLTIASDQLAPRYYIWVFPLINTIILMFSLWYGRHTDLDHERYIARLSLLTGLVLMILLLIAQLRIIKIIL